MPPRSRKRNRPAAGARPAPRLRGEERNAAIRASLVPLQPGERPWPLKTATVLAALLGVGNIVQAIIGSKVHLGTSRTSVAGSIPFALVMLICAAGMWRLRYWAVLGFQALTAIIIIAFTFVAVTANDIGRLVIAIAIVAGLGTLFWKLVRILSRMQMPKP